MTIQINDNSLTVIDALVREGINEEYTLSFSVPITSASNWALVETGAVVVYAEQSFDIVRAEKVRDTSGNLMVFAECEHVSYRLGEIAEDGYLRQNATRQQFMDDLVADTDFTVGAVDDPSESIPVLRIDGGNRRALLLEGMQLFGCSVGYDGFAIDMLNRRGTATGATITAGINAIEIRDVNDSREPEVRKLWGEIAVAELAALPEYGSPYAVNLGDTVTLVDTDLGIDEQLDIVHYAFDPIFPMESRVFLGARPRGIEQTVVSIMEKDPQLRTRPARLIIEDEENAGSYQAEEWEFAFFPRGWRKKPLGLTWGEEEGDQPLLEEVESRTGLPTAEIEDYDGLLVMAVETEVRDTDTGKNIWTFESDLQTGTAQIGGLAVMDDVLPDGKLSVPANVIWDGGEAYFDVLLHDRGDALEAGMNIEDGVEITVWLLDGIWQGFVTEEMYFRELEDFDHFEKIPQGGFTIGKKPDNPSAAVPKQESAIIRGFPRADEIDGYDRLNPNQALFHEIAEAGVEPRLVWREVDSIEELAETYRIYNGFESPYDSGLICARHDREDGSGPFDILEGRIAEESPSTDPGFVIVTKDEEEDEWENLSPPNVRRTDIDWQWDGVSGAITLERVNDNLWKITSGAWSVGAEKSGTSPIGHYTAEYVEGDFKKTVHFIVAADEE